MPAASAKVKCSTTRPGCARCTERGLSCFYAPSNRYGRRPAYKATPPASVFPNNRVLLSRNVSEWPHSEPAFRAQHSSLSPVPSTLDLAFSELDRVRTIESLASGVMPSTLISNTLTHNLNPVATTSHCCLTQAAQLLIEARADQNDLRHSPQEASEQHAEQTLQNALWSNRKILDRVAMILTCDCTEDDNQIMVLVSLVWFHAIDRYLQAVAAAGHVGSIIQRDHVKQSVDVLLGELRDLSPLVETLSDRGAEDWLAHGGMGVSGTVVKSLQGDLTRYLCHLYLKTEQLQQDLV